MGKKHKKYKEHEDPIDKLKEWQDNQYNPGYYTGGKIPPYVDIPPKTSLFGRVYQIGARIVGPLEILAGAALIFIAVKVSWIIGEEHHWRGNFFEALAAGIIVSGLGILFILSGLKYIKTVKSKAKCKS
ncbi:hypothetical protein [Sporomusa sp. GT1]|uniref:hypothetical protein n=1 Tax=Sporomusa TaxID=2375 RepID=UPI00166451F3|nr:hypothetical protein [Sporomusa sp. GT1]